MLVVAMAAACFACFPGPRAGAQNGGGSVSAAQRQELQDKVERVRSGVQQMKAKGEDPKPVFQLMKDVKPLIDKGRIDEAMSRVDQALVLVGDTGGASGAPAPSPGSGAAPSAPLPPGGPAGNGWRHASNAPVLDILRSPAGLPARLQKSPLRNWNDPSVMKEGDHYTMWASLGMRGGGKDVSIYKLTSTNGTDWTLANGGEPVLEPGRGWDSYGVETPAVIKAGGTYHMYYTAYADPPSPVYYTMGHATSPDGDHWTRQGELTSLTSVVGKKHRDGNPWGWLARAEPAPVYVDGTFYLYFTDVHCRRDDCKPSDGVMAQRGISLAKSSDGQNFTQVGSEPVLLQSASYPPSAGWEGYSTPWAYHDGHSFHLFADVFRQVGDKHYQTRIAHYQSEDGVHFREVERDVVKIEGHPWATQSVRAPTAILDGGHWMLWYAGDNFDQEHHPKDMLGAIRSGEVRMGIGLVTQ